MSPPTISRSLEENRTWHFGPERQQEVKRTAEELGFTGVHFLPTTEIVVSNWVGLKCRYGCSNYNTSWCCPPAAPDLRTTRDLLSEYELALLLVSESRNAQFYRNSAEKRRTQIKQWKATVSFERKLFLIGYYKAFGLPAESCALCKRCAYPEPCKFPNDKRPSLEACSIDVFKTIQHVGRAVKLVNGVAETYHCYSLILLF